MYQNPGESVRTSPKTYQVVLDTKHPWSPTSLIRNKTKDRVLVRVKLENVYYLDISGQGKIKRVSRRFVGASKDQKII